MRVGNTLSRGPVPDIAKKEVVLVVVQVQASVVLHPKPLAGNSARVNHDVVNTLGGEIVDDSKYLGTH